MLSHVAILWDYAMNSQKEKRAYISNSGLYTKLELECSVTHTVQEEYFHTLAVLPLLVCMFEIWIQSSTLTPFGSP